MKIALVFIMRVSFSIKINNSTISIHALTKFVTKGIFKTCASLFLLKSVLFGCILSSTISLATTFAKTSEDLIIENPVREYKKFSQRLRSEGPNASFPEFKPLVDSLMGKLNSEKIKSLIERDLTLKLSWQEVVTDLIHVNLDFSYEDKASYPYQLDYEKPFPYRPTIEAIESAVRFFDKVERITNPKAVPRYHFDRYAYHKHSVLADSEVIFFPTMRSLSFSDLIRVRSVPIGFVGVITETTRVDRYFQTPLEFWYHDINHIRRLFGYLKRSAEAARLKTLAQKTKLYQSFDDFIQNKIMPAIEKLPKGSDPARVAIRRLMRLLVFEIFHESAVSPDPKSIAKDLLRGPSEKTPYEALSLIRNVSLEDIEAKRTAVGNIESGAASIVEKNSSNEAAQVHFFYDRDLGLLANVYNKIVYGYYDDPGSPSELIAPVKFRRSVYLAAAAMELLNVIGQMTSNITSDLLVKLAITKEGRPELFNYEQIMPHEGDMPADKLPFATEPISAVEAIEQIKSLKKKVHTLFGYADGGYENFESVEKDIRKYLEKLNPNLDIIAIGATEVGIGAAYEIAKSMGFETIGIVSQKSLLYSGRFSPHVDRIYIISDQYWGGYIPGSRNRKLTPTMQTFVEASDFVLVIGGNGNSAAMIQESAQRKIPVEFLSAKMDSKAAKKMGIKNLNGSAEKVWESITRSQVNLICRKIFT